MSDKVILGETRPEAISRVQERLGPAASRPLAEATFWALARRGKITMDQKDGIYLIEAEIKDSDLQQTATDSIQQATQQKLQARMTRSRGPIRHFAINHNNTHTARVSTVWHSASAKSMFAPSLAQAEGFKPGDIDQNLSVPLNNPVNPDNNDPNAE